MVFRAVVLTWVLAGTAVTAARAQEISGIVSGLDGQRPVQGALVLLMNQADEQVWGVLTDELGLYRMRDIAPGTYRLATRRIGYADGETEWFEMGAQGTLFFRIRVPRAVIAVEGITVDPERRCHTLEQDDASTIAQFWEEARKALEITQFTRGMRDIAFRSRTFRRELGPEDLEVLSEELTPREGIGVMPFGSAPPDSLALLGYVQGSATEGRVYHAPDAEALLSADFMNTHCLRFHDDPHWRDSVGIRIQPAGDRGVPEIEGTIWLDGGTLSLRRFEFRYVDADLTVDAPEAGGEVRFEELTSGAWIVSGWTIRMPNLSIARRGRRIRYTLDGYREVGGTVLEMWDGEGRSLRKAPPAPGGPGPPGT